MNSIHIKMNLLNRSNRLSLLINDRGVGTTVRQRLTDSSRIGIAHRAV